MVGRTRLAAGFLVVLTAACAPSEEAAPHVLLEGLFDEWTDAVNVIDDPPDAPESEVDVLSVQALDDPWWLYLALDVGNEVAVQSMRGTLQLLFDADDDPGTGGDLYDMEGVDLIVDFSPLTVLRPSPGAGIRVRAVGADGRPREIERHGLGVVAAPTWAAPRVELRISRFGHPAIELFERRFRMRAVYRHGGRVLDETTVGSYDLRTARAERAVQAAGRLPAKPDGALRVAQWNVSGRSFDRSFPDFARVLAAVRPDVIMLDEVPATVTPDAVRDFFAQEPLRALGEWSFVLGSTGGRQRTLVATRAGEIRPAERLQAPGYPDEALDRVRAQLSTSDNAPLWERVLESEARNGLAAAGAWVSVGDSETLFVSLDLQAAGWPGSPHDVLRAAQAEVLRDLVRVELEDRPRPVVLGGDLNLVGSRAPLFALVRGLDVDGTDLTAVDAERLGERTLTTWRMPDLLFAPGRLDFLLVPDAALSVVNGFVFATEDLAADELTRLGLERNLMLELSDHLLLVADLRSGPDSDATGPAG